MSGWKASVGVYICQVGRVELGGREREKEKEKERRETGDGRERGREELFSVRPKKKKKAFPSVGSGSG